LPALVGSTPIALRPFMTVSIRRRWLGRYDLIPSRRCAFCSFT
jgi:hypothetical protein